MTYFDDKPYSCRLYPNEREYLNRSDFESFREYVHYSIKYFKTLEKKNAKQENIRTNQLNVILIGLGIFFLFYSFSVTNLYAWIISFLLGVSLIIYGLIEILLMLLKKIKVEKQIGRTKTD